MGKALQPNQPAKESQNVETYLGRIRKRVNPTETALEELREVKQMQSETKAADLQNKVLDLKSTLVDQQLETLTNPHKKADSQNIASMLFKDKTPEQIEEILSKLTPEMVQKLRMVASATDPTLVALSSQPATQGQTGNEMLLQYLLKKADDKPQQGITMADVVAIVRLVNETKPQSTPQVVQAPPQNASTQLLETVKVFAAINELGSKNNKELLDLKLKAIEDKMPPDPIEQIKYVKEVASTLGLSSGQRSEIDLKLAEMKQNENLDMKRLDWEQRKYELEQDADNQKWEQIKGILEGPIGQAISNVGSAGADRVRGRPKGNSNAPKPVQTQCPNCTKVIYVDSEAATAICGNCGAVLQKQADKQADAPAPPPQTTAHVDVAPESQPPAEQDEVSESEGEETNGPDETEAEDGTEAEQSG